MYSYILVGFGGFFGAISRFGLGQLVRAYFPLTFPLATLTVNVLGCLAIGAFFSWAKGSPGLSLFFAVGFLGSFTTFSAFGFETLELMKSGNLGLGFVNIFGNVLLCLGAVYVGTMLVGFR
jgi:fluoride exporter